MSEPGKAPVPKLSGLAESFSLGTYQHYKGNVYMAMAIARNEKTLDEMVVYQSLQNDEEVWVRPLNEFLEKVKHNGNEIPRFTYID